MFRYDDIINYCSNYKIENGKVIDQASQQEVLDESIVLRVKSAILFFLEAREWCEADIQQFGEVSLTQEEYIRRVMDQFGVSNHSNNFEVNQLIQGLLSSSGHYEETFTGKDLYNSKFSFLVEPKQDYGLSYLRLKFQEKGLDIENFTIHLEESEHQEISKVVVDFQVKKYGKENTTKYQHPKAEELKELERQKQVAKKNHNSEMYRRVMQEMEKMIQEYPAVVSREEWERMDLSQQISFVQVKMKEAKILYDKDSFDYWASNLKRLEAKLGSEVSISMDSRNGDTSKEKKDYSYYYNRMMESVLEYQTGFGLSESEKKRLLGEIFYYEECVVDAVSTEEEKSELSTLLSHELTENLMQVRLQKIIQLELNDKYQECSNSTVKPEKNLPRKSSSYPKNEEAVKDLVDSFRLRFEPVKTMYQAMMDDGHIDDKELNVLIGMIRGLIVEGYSLKDQAVTMSDKKMILAMIQILEEKRKKLTQIQLGMEEAME